MTPVSKGGVGPVALVFRRVRLVVDVHRQWDTDLSSK